MSAGSFLAIAISFLLFEAALSFSFAHHAQLPITRGRLCACLLEQPSIVSTYRMLDTRTDAPSAKVVSPFRFDFHLRPVFSRSRSTLLSVYSKSQKETDEVAGTLRSEAASQSTSKKPWFAIDIKLLVLLLLVGQNAMQMLSMRYSRILISSGTSPPYLSSAAVVVSEALKVAACLLVLAIQHGRALPQVFEQTKLSKDEKALFHCCRACARTSIYRPRAGAQRRYRGL